MAIATCPKCATKLKVPDGTSASVRCPKCQTVFKTNTPAPAAPEFEVVDEPAPPPKPLPKPAAPTSRPSSAAPPPKPADNPFTNLDEEDRPRKKRRDDDEDDDDRPRKKRRDDDEDDDRPRSKKRSRDDDDEEDRPRKKRRDDEEDDDDRPRSKKRSRDDDEDDDDRPRKKSRDRDDTDYSPPGKKNKFGLARTGVMLLLISLGLYGASMALQVLFIGIALIGGVIPNGIGLMTGLLGLANWIVGVVGLGLCIAGPSRARGLAIAAVSVAAVHLILMFVVVNDADHAGANIAVPMLSAMNRISNVQQIGRELQKEEQKNPGSARAKELREDLKSLTDDDSREDAGILISGRNGGRNRMRWADLTTYLTYSDKIIAILSYQSKGFSDALLGIFTGLLELARLILIALMLGSLGYAAKSDAAISKGKLGWIIAASTGGGALLVMLLSFVIADSTKPDAKDASPKLPEQPSMTGKSFEEVQRAQIEYQKQVQAEFEKFQQKQESARKSPMRWLAIGELLVLVLHLGAIVMPALAALAIFSATKSGGGGGGTKYRKRTRRDDDDDD